MTRGGADRYPTRPYEQEALSGCGDSRCGLYGLVFCPARRGTPVAVRVEAQAETPASFAKTARTGSEDKQSDSAASAAAARPPSNVQGDPRRLTSAADTAAVVPSADEPLQALLASGRLLESRARPAPTFPKMPTGSSDTAVVVEIYQTTFKYPLVRVERNAAGTVLTAAVADHVIVRRRAGVTHEQFAAFVQAAGLTIRKRLYGDSGYLVSRSAKTLEALEYLQTRLKPEEPASPAEVAEPDPVVTICAVTNDPLFSRLSGMNNGRDADIDAPEAWNTATDASSVVVGVIDIPGNVAGALHPLAERGQPGVHGAPAGAQDGLPYGEGGEGNDENSKRDLHFKKEVPGLSAPAPGCGMLCSAFPARLRGSRKVCLRRCRGFRESPPLFSRAQRRSRRAGPPLRA